MIKLKFRKNETGKQVGEEHQAGQNSFSSKAFFFIAFLSCLLFQNLYGQPPTITDFTPTSGTVGTPITINGTNFNITPSNNIVFFGATQAAVSTASATSLTLTVPMGATYSPITVLNTSTGFIAYSTTNFTPTFTPNKGDITTSDFSAKLDFAAGTNPYSVAIGDLDGDGKADLAVANTNNATVSVFRNTGSSGTISYATKVDLATGVNPNAVAIGDLDGDGKADLAVTNGTSTTVSVFRNTGSSGTISYATKVDFATGVNPNSVAIGDLDGDGKTDIVVGNAYNASISVFRNTGSSGTVSYAPKVDFTTGSFPWDVAVGDFDGDNKTDLAVVNYGNNTVSVFRNTGSSGTISYAPKVDFTTGLFVYNVAAGDLDGDGKIDLAVANGNGTSVCVLRNTSSIGTVSFATKVDFATAGSLSVTIGDLDGDSKADLATVNQTSSVVSVFRNTGSSGTVSFAAKVDFVTGTNPISVAIGDLDGDGKADLAVANGATASNSVSILRNNPVFSGTPTITSFTPTSGAIGTAVTITGTNFSTTPANNTVQFNGTTATVTASTTTSITTTVPTGATTGTISVTVAGITATSVTNFVITTVPAGLPALEWAKGHVGSLDTFLESATTDASGNVYTTGEFSETTDFDPGTGVLNLTSAGNFDIYVSKQNTQGELVWAFRLGSTNQDTGTSITTDASGNVYVAGSHGADVDFDPGAGNTTLTGTGNFLCKYGPNGNFIWAVPFSTNFSGPWSMIVDTNQDVCIATSFTGTIDADPGAPTVTLTSAGSSDICLLKLNSNAGFIWANRIGSTSGDVSNRLAIDPSGNFHVAGFFNGTVDFDPGAGTANLTSAGGNDIFIAKLSSAGNYTWARRVGNTGSFDSGHGIAVDNGGNVLITGAFENTVDFDPGAAVSNLTAFGSQDIYVLKLNAAGNFLWAKNMGGTNSEIGVSIKTDAAGNVFSTGFYRATVDFDPGAGTFNLVTGNNRQVYISKLDASGNFAWALSTQSAAAVAESPLLALDPSGNIIVAGIIDGGTVDVDPGTCVVNITAPFVGVFIIKLSLTASPSCGSTITINTQPSSSSGCVGASATFTATASGTTNITYQWQKFDGATFNNITNTGGYFGTTSATLTVNTNGNFGAGDYRCKVSGDLATDKFSNTAALTLNTYPVVTISQNDSQLMASSGGSYQWYHDNNPVSGATEQTFEISVFEYGVYAVDVINNGCLTHSDDYVYLITGTELNVGSTTIKVYPNPSQHELFVNVDDQATLTLLDVMGRNVKTKTLLPDHPNRIEIQDLMSGTYVLMIKSATKIDYIKIFKTH